MELTPIRYFVRLAEELNFTHAAKSLFITQSTLSVSIRQLEEELGVRLFDRIGRKVFLTEEGGIFLDYARRALENIGEGIEKVNAFNHIYRGNLCVGVTYSTCEILNSCLVPYTEKYPEVHLNVMMSITVEEVINSILTNKLDIAITYRPDRLPPSIAEELLSETPLSLIVHRSHPLAGRKEVSLEEIMSFPFVTCIKGMHTRTMTERLFAANNLQPVPRMEVNDPNLILEMVETGRWVSILSPLSIQHKKDCVAVPIAGGKEFFSVCALWLKGRSKQVLCRTLLDEVVLRASFRPLSV